MSDQTRVDPRPFTEEDRDLLDCWIGDSVLAREQMIPEERAALARALAYIEELETTVKLLTTEAHDDE